MTSIETTAEPDARPQSRQRVLSRVLVGAYAVLAVGYLAWSMHAPVTILTTANHDDALFWSHAAHLIDGDWLGPYDNLTLAKGPAFSFFLAANYLAGTPITLALAGTYLLATGLVVRAMQRLGLNRYLALATFAVVLFHPAVVPTRIIRDDICASLLLIALAGALRIIAVGSRRPSSLAASGAFGLALGFLWITREDSVWIVPGLVTLLGLALVAARRDRQMLIRRLTHMGVYLLAAVAVVFAVSLVNLVTYGRFTVTDYNDGSFSRVMKVLNSVQAGDEVAFAPVPAAKREAIYSVSPSFAALKANLEAPDNVWKAQGCPFYPQTCGDYAGGWWSWALRDAVAQSGNYSSAAAARDYYDRISDEVSAACDAGRLTCRANPVPFMPNLAAGQVNAIPESLRQAALLLLTQQQSSLDVPSEEPLVDLGQAQLLLGNPRIVPPTSQSGAQVVGWYRSPDGSWLVTTCTDASTKEQTQRSVARLPSPDVAAQFDDPAASNNRFSTVVPLGQGCTLGSSVAGSQQISLASLSGHVPTSLDLGNGTTLYIDAVSQTSVPPAWPATILSFLFSIYRILVPTLAAAGALALVAGVVLGSRAAPPRSLLFIPAIAMWILIASRIAVLVLVDVSSFPALTFEYMNPAFPLLVLASVASLQALAYQIARRR